MRIALIPNLDKNHALEYTIRLCRMLRAWGAEPMLPLYMRAHGADGTFVPEEALFAQCDAVLTIGGDGTILHAAKHAVRCGKPLIGLNCGRLGFLAELEAGEMELLHNLVTHQYTTTPRMLLDVTVYADGETRCLALNDAVISRAGLPRLVEWSVQYQQQCLCRCRADGLIFATPVGSTAYSLSAGGPVIDPVSHCILMTPICPHSVFGRPVVFGADSVLCVRPILNDGESVNVSVDGEENFALRAGDRIEIRKAAEELQLIQLKQRLFYDIFTAKFSTGE